MKTPKFDTVNGKKGQTVVEFALTVPIVLILVLTVIEGGWLLFTYTSLTSAGREAARYGAGVGDNSSGTILYNDCDGIKSAALRIGQFAGIKASDIHIYHDTGPNTTKTEYCTVANPTANFAQDDRILVEINVIYTPISPLVHLPSFPLHSQNAHTVLLGANVVAVPQVFSGGGQTCDVSHYTVVSQSNILGPTDTVVIRNDSGTATSIVSVLIVWDTTGGPLLNSISGIPGLSGLPSVGPSYSSSTSMPLPTGQTSFSLNFSKPLKSNVIIRLTLAGDNQCAFGQ
jgi:Flp pilus assembly protein TadG